MSERRPKSYQRFFAELKRRHVFRVMAVYGIVGFVLLQVADLAIPALLLPEWTYRFVALILLLGFPIALIIAWAFEVTPEGIRKTKAADPAQILAIIDQPASRRWPAGLLALLGGALLLAGGWWAGRQTAPDVTAEATTGSAEDRAAESGPAMAGPEDADRPSIAVLPFADMSPEGDQEYFSDGITEELLNTLAKIRDLKVMARTSAFAFKGENLDMRAVGDSLNAGYLVEGSVRKAGDELRITAQLIDAEDGSHLWSESYDRRLENVFEIQTEIAEAIADELRVPLGLDQGEQLVSPTEDLEAFDLYLAGRARMRERGESVEEAVRLFEAAVARDSSWAPAWAGLAEAHTLVPYYTSAQPDSALWATNLAAAERAAERALAVDPENASALVALASVHRDRWNWDAAESAYGRALSVDPENVEAHQQYAEFLSYVGRLDEAYAAAHRALALDRAPIRLNIVGLIASYNRRYEEAVDVLSEGIRADSAGRVRALRTNLASVHLAQGDWAQYRESLLQNLRGAEEQVRQLRELWPAGTPLTIDVLEGAEVTQGPEAAAMFLVLGAKDRALEALEGYGQQVPYGQSPRRLFRPSFEPLWDESRFRALLRRFNLEGVRPQRLEPRRRDDE